MQGLKGHSAKKNPLLEKQHEVGKKADCFPDQSKTEDSGYNDYFKTGRNIML